MLNLDDEAKLEHLIERVVRRVIKEFMDSDFKGYELLKSDYKLPGPNMPGNFQWPMIAST